MQTSPNVPSTPAGSSAAVYAQAPAPRPLILLTDRQEAFCQAMAANVGGAEAARRAGYSPNGAKQRGAHLMTMPEIRIRVDQLRAARSGRYEADLEEAAETVRTIIGEALEKKSLALALRAVELRLKLRGAMLDKRIPLYHPGDYPNGRHPDADLETLPIDPDEDADYGTSVATGEAVGPAAQIQIVTSDSDPAQKDLKAGAPSAADPTAKAAPTRGRRGGKADFPRRGGFDPGGNAPRRTASLLATTSLSAAWDVPPILPPTMRAA